MAVDAVGQGRCQLGKVLPGSYIAVVNAAITSARVNVSG